MDISLVLKVCPTCLGDLVFTTDVSGNYYRCLQCSERAIPNGHSERRKSLIASARHGNLPRQALAG